MREGTIMGLGRPERPPPLALRENAGSAYQGWDSTYDLEWSAAALPGYRPALDGKEVNTHPRQEPHRWARIVRPKPGLEAALVGLDWCLVTSRVTKHLCFSWQPTYRIFSDKFFVFPTESWVTFAVMQSRVHEVWARLLGSTLGETLRYISTSCFDTFPFPTAGTGLEKAGQDLYEYRAGYMLETNQGLTKVYNDPPPLLRDLHEAMDRAVLDAYGWGDIDVPGYPEPLPMEIIDRLYRLNQERCL